jgi:hypothetical protein
VYILVEFYSIMASKPTMMIIFPGIVLIPEQKVVKNRIILVSLQF